LPGGTPPSRFIHWREKFSAVFLEDIKHPDDEGHFDVFRVIAKIPDPPFEIPLEGSASFIGSGSRTLVQSRCTKC
jgi:hypothetical protein